MPKRKKNTHLLARGLGEPEGPLVHERVLDIEVVWVMENGDISVLFAICRLLSVILTVDGLLLLLTVLCRGHHRGF